MWTLDTMIATLDREAVRIVTAIPCVTAAKQLLDYQGDRSLSLQTVKFVTSAVQGSSASSLREHRDLASKQWEIRRARSRADLEKMMTARLILYNCDTLAWIWAREGPSLEAPGTPPCRRASRRSAAGCSGTCWPCSSASPSSRGGRPRSGGAGVRRRGARRPGGRGRGAARTRRRRKAGRRRRRRPRPLGGGVRPRRRPQPPPPQAPRRRGRRGGA